MEPSTIFYSNYIIDSTRLDSTEPIVVTNSGLKSKNTQTRYQNQVGSENVQAKSLLAWTRPDQPASSTRHNLINHLGFRTYSTYAF
jgi:hypothetical protein